MTQTRPEFKRRYVESVLGAPSSKRQRGVCGRVFIAQFFFFFFFFFFFEMHIKVPKHARGRRGAGGAACVYTGDRRIVRRRRGRGADVTR